MLLNRNIASQPATAKITLRKIQWFTNPCKSSYKQISWLGTWIFRRHSLMYCTDEIKWDNCLIWLEKAEVTPTYQHVPLKHISCTVQLNICQYIISNMEILKPFRTKILNLFHLIYHRRMTWNSSPFGFMEVFSSPSLDQQLLPKEIYGLSK